MPSPPRSTSAARRWRGVTATPTRRSAPSCWRKGPTCPRLSGRRRGNTPTPSPARLRDSLPERAAMNRWTAFFLILLRLAIGWHFLFEGLNKVQSVYVGPTVTNRPFSSAGYFREAPGPLGGWYRQLEGDSDEKLLNRLEVQPPPPGEDAATAKPYLRMPQGLKEEYDNYLARFQA